MLLNISQVRLLILTAVSMKMARNRFLARGLLIALMMEAASTSEASVNFYQTTRRNNPEGSHF
jgi:hypothetical protein